MGEARRRRLAGFDRAAWRERQRAQVATFSPPKLNEPMTVSGLLKKAFVDEVKQTLKAKRAVAKAWRSADGRTLYATDGISIRRIQGV